jgi:hypothetical protein
MQEEFCGTKSDNQSKLLMIERMQPLLRQDENSGFPAKTEIFIFYARRIMGMKAS